ncbi:type VII secretion target [Micromonospora maritima]|uniref:Type VII secretion target n=1 Tax=Micromonospora maritima TaxID=986711 RepID=A0ABW7ZP89_9ACTN
MEEPFDVEPELLRAVARELADDARRLAAGPGGATQPLLVAPADGWRSAGALADLEAAVRRWSGALAARVADTAEALRAGADGYEAVDDRAAHRLAGIPR